MRATEQYGRLFKAALKENKLNDYVESGTRKEGFWTTLRRNFSEKKVTSRDFSIRALFEEFVIDDHGEPCGRALIKDWGYASTRPENRSDGANLHKLQEAGAVMTGAFSNITGQIVYNEVMDAWNNPAFIADSLVTNISTSFLDGERIPGISVVANENETIGEGQPYPLAGVSEQYVDTPPPDKRGSIIPLTREVIIADRTGVLLERANSITQSLRISKERRVLSVATGQTNTWSRNGGTADTYVTPAGAAPHDFENEHTEGLGDWTDIEAALLLFDAMTDPDTGEPITVMPRQLLVPTDLLFTARRILSATQINTRTGTDIQGGATTEADTETVSGNPLSPLTMTILSNAFVSDVSGDDNDWYLGDFPRAFRYMEVWPINTVQAPTNSEQEFTNDIVQRIKVSEYGVPAIIEPRYVVRAAVAAP